MPIIPRRRTAGAGRRRADLRAAVADYLEISRSPLRSAEPRWFALAEDAAWERVRMLAGLAPAGPEEPGADLAEESPLRGSGLTGTRPRRP